VKQYAEMVDAELLTPETNLKLIEKGSTSNEEYSAKSDLLSEKTTPNFKVETSQAQTHSEGMNMTQQQVSEINKLLEADSSSDSDESSSSSSSDSDFGVSIDQPK
jgi:hypothetical protein